MILLDQVIGVAMTVGLPWAVEPIMVLPKSGTKNAAWSWSTPSSSQTVASPSCRSLRRSGGCQVRPRTAAACAGGRPAKPSDRSAMSHLLQFSRAIYYD